MADHKRVRVVESHDEKELLKVNFTSNEKTSIKIEEGKIEQRDELEMVESDTRTEVEKVLEDILVEEVGPCGRYQMWTFVALAITLVTLASSGEFNFTTARINTRCLVPECEDAVSIEFTPSWLPRAIPPVEEWSPTLDSCRRFANTTHTRGYGYCYADYFDHRHTLPCEEFVYETKHTVVYDFNLGCSEWRRSLIGLARAVGAIVSIPLADYATRRWGWRPALLLGVFASGCLGLSRRYVDTYNTFIGLEFMEAAFSAGTYSNAIYLALELVGSDYCNILYGSLATCMALGQVWLPLLAWLLPDWRLLTLALYLPQLLSLGYLWTLDESLHWHLSKGRFEHAEALLKKVAKTNGTKLSEKSLHSFQTAARVDEKNKILQESLAQKSLFEALVRDKQILIRCLVLPLWWTAVTLINNGLTINSVYIPGNAYFQYAAVAAASALGVWISYFLLAFPRKSILLRSFWICGICQILYCFIGIDNYWMGLALYLVSKCSMGLAHVAVLAVAPELAAGRPQHRLPVFYYKIGRIGAVVATLTPAMGYELEQLQFLLFGILALVCSCLSPIVPETCWGDVPASTRESQDSKREDPISTPLSPVPTEHDPALPLNVFGLARDDPAPTPGGPAARRD